MNELIKALETLCEVIETSIEEGSTLLECPAAVEARELIANTRRAEIESAPPSETEIHRRREQRMRWFVNEFHRNMKDQYWQPNMQAYVVTNDSWKVILEAYAYALWQIGVIPKPEVDEKQGTIPPKCEV